MSKASPRSIPYGLAEKEELNTFRVINLKTEGAGAISQTWMGERGHQQCDYQLQSLSLGHSAIPGEAEGMERRE